MFWQERLLLIHGCPSPVPGKQGHWKVGSLRRLLWNISLACIVRTYDLSVQHRQHVLTSTFTAFGCNASMMYSGTAILLILLLLYKHFLQELVKQDTVGLASLHSINASAMRLQLHFQRPEFHIVWICKVATPLQYCWHTVYIVPRNDTWSCCSCMCMHANAVAFHRYCATTGTPPVMTDNRV